MAAKLASPRAELTVIRGMCAKDKAIAGTLIRQVDESHFYSEESQELYKAILSKLAETGETPSYRLLIEDPNLSEEARSHLRNSEATITTINEAKSAAKILNRYRQHRGLYNIGQYLKTTFEESKIDSEVVLSKIASAINTIRATKSTKENFLHFGKGDSASKTINSILYDDLSENIIATGIKDFDAVASGFARGSLVTIGANSGGGKCLIGNTKVLLPDGSSTTLEGIWNTAKSDIEPVVHDASGKASMRAISLKVQTYEGVGDAIRVFKTSGKTIRITLDDNTIIEGLAEHKLMCSDNSSLGYGWVRLDQLTIESDVLSYEEMQQLLRKPR